MDQITIARAEPADCGELAELYAEDMRALGNDVAAADLIGVVDATLQSQGTGALSWVARAPTGIIAGALLAAPFLSLKVAGRALWIEELYVRPDYRRRGIGRLLVEHLMDWAEAEGYQGVELEAYHMNTGASVLYRSMGFRRLARERYCYYFE